jgi:aspartate-semialdehyde dehydrogenase
MVAILEERNFPVDSLRLMASSRSAGSVVETRWGSVTVEDLATADPAGIDYALHSAGGDRSREYAPAFAAAGAVVVDNSSAFRMRDDVPLVVIGVNDQALGNHQGIVANPNCTTMNLMMAAGPLHGAFGLTSMVACSYQAVSGSGQQGTAELLRQTEALGKDPDALVSGEWIDPGSEVYPRPIAWNVVPFAGNAGADGYTDEEWKLVHESRKILELPALRVEPTCVRVPVITGHGIAATMRFSRPVGVDEAAQVLVGAPGLELWEDKTPTPLDSAGRDEVLAGRLRPTVGEPGGINLWVVGDNLRKGAALNAVQIAEALL